MCTDCIWTHGGHTVGTRVGTACEMSAQSHDWRDCKVGEWLLLLLRFAVTREPAHRFDALAMADELDALGMRWRPAAPRFFRNTSTDVCDAIAASENGHS